MAKYGYTLVQHSGYGYADKPGFKRGVESRGIDTAKERDLVKRVGGILVDTHSEVDALEEQVNFPPGTGIYPNAQGTFSDKKVDGLRIYIPVTAVVG